MNAIYKLLTLNRNACISTFNKLRRLKGFDCKVILPQEENQTIFGLEDLVPLDFDNAQDMVDREVLVMIEGKVADENAYVGRTYRDAPNVDGLIFINTDEELLSGDFARVKVTGAVDYDLIGELI